MEAIASHGCVSARGTSANGCWEMHATGGKQEASDRPAEPLVLAGDCS